MLVIISLFVLPKNSSLFSVFQISEKPLTVTKGHYGYSYVVEISFSHDSLLPWLEQLKAPLPLLLLDADWIKRSPNEVRWLKEKQFPVGLLGHKGDSYTDLNILNQEITIFEKNFSKKPLWYVTRDYLFTDEMKKYLFASEINTLAPSNIWTPNTAKLKLKKGSIITIPFHEHSDINIKTVHSFLNNYHFISIEENLFGYSVKTRTFP